MIGGTGRILTRRQLVRGLGAAGLGGVVAVALGGCGEGQVVTETKLQTVTVEVPVEKVVTKEVVKEVLVEKTVEVEKVVTQIVEKEKVVEKLVTAAPAAPAPGSIELNISHTWPADRQPEQEEFDRTFMQKHPEYSIKTTYATWDEYSDKWLPQAAARTLPDIMYLGDTWVGMWAKLGLFVRLDTYFASDPAFNLEDYVAASFEPSTIKGINYGIGYDWNGPAVGWDMGVGG